MAVELVSGEVDATDELRNVQISRFELAAGSDPAAESVLFTLTDVSKAAGLIGYTVRVVPDNPLLASMAEMGLAAVAE